MFKKLRRDAATPNKVTTKCRAEVELGRDYWLIQHERLHRFMLASTFYCQSAEVEDGGRCKQL